MKKNLAKKVTLSILAGAVLMSSSVVWAATNPDEVVGLTKDDVNDAYIWKGVSGGAPNGEVNKPSDMFTYDFYGAYDDGNNSATGGKVTINGGTFDGTEVYGGYVESGTGDASDNKVEISDVVTGSPFSYISGGEAWDAGNANYNRVTLSAKDATYKYDIYGGYSDDSGDANNNAVNISAGTF